MFELGADHLAAAFPKMRSALQKYLKGGCNDSPATFRRFVYAVPRAGLCAVLNRQFDLPDRPCTANFWVIWRLAG